MGHLKKQLQELQQKLALIEMINRPSRGSGHLEILLTKLENIQIRMEGDKRHNNPHVHINIGKMPHAATYEINTSKRIVGTKPLYENAVRDWLTDHREKLLEVWSLMQDGKDVTSYVEELKVNQDD